jgi:nucleoside-diphosphate-sugar epimerase
MKKKVIVTGGSGMLGCAVTRELVRDGFEVLSIDRTPAPAHRPSWVADIRDPAVMMQASVGCMGIVHLAAHIAPNLAADHDTFNDNTRMTYNVYNAAFLMGVQRVVVASSIAAYGFLYGDRSRVPAYLPIDENHPCLPTDAYGQSKVAGEMLGSSFAQKGIEAIASLRFPGINYDPSFKRIQSFMRDPAHRTPGFWSYIDVLDASRACVKALTGGISGHRTYNVAAQDSNMRETTATLIARFFPTLHELRRIDETNWSGIDSSRIERELGFSARISWKDAINANMK